VSLIQAGTRFSSTCQILHDELTAQTTLRPLESLSMQTAESEEFTSLIVCTVKSSCLQNLNSSFLSKNNNDWNDFYAVLSTFLAFFLHLSAWKMFYFFD
jgi:hypothetical protein